MSLKLKLISCISAFILVLSMLFVGVFAAQNVQLNVGGTVSFTASSVYAKVTGSYVGTKEQPSTAKQLTQIDIDADTTDGAVSMPDDWTSMPLNFDSSASPITVTITIQNLASDRAIAVSLTDNTDITGVSVARTYNSSSFSDNTSSQTISGGESGTFTFTLSLTSKNNDISGAFDLDLNLTNSSTTTTEGYNFKFINSTSTETARTIYIRVDEGEVQTIESGQEVDLHGNSLYISDISSSLEIGSYSVMGEIELYAPGSGANYHLEINGEKVASNEGAAWQHVNSVPNGNIYLFYNTEFVGIGTMTENTIIEFADGY